MKKILITVLLCIMSVTSAFAAPSIPIYYNSQPLNLSQSPVIQNGTTWVPFKEVFSALGFTIKLDKKTSTAIASSSSMTIKITVGNKTANINDKEQAMSVAPKLIGGAIFVPMKFISESSGCAVSWNSKNQYVSIGKVDQDLIDIYERVSLFDTGNTLGKYRYEDMYTEKGTGKYAGYHKLMGHPYIGYNLYYKNSGNGDTSNIQLAIEPLNLNLGKAVKWHYNGATFTTTKREVFNFLSGISEIPGFNINLSKDQLKNIFGTVYDEWVSDGAVKSSASDLVEGYIHYYDGSTFAYYYSRYQTLKLIETGKEEQAKAEETEKMEADKVAQAQNDYENKQIALYKQFTSEWTSTSRLEKVYGVSAVWLGDTIIFSKGGNKIFTIHNSPQSSFAENTIYNGDGIQYAYLKTMLYDFPEAKDGTGKYKVEVNELSFKTEDLKNAGIIK